MHKYPSIDEAPRIGEEVYAYDKLDGSNVRAEWSPKRAEFFKYGSRGQLLDQARDPILGKAPAIIKAKYEDSIRALIERLDHGKGEHMTFFFEFVGLHTFAGRHREDDVFDVTLFDIWHPKLGMLGPQLFFELTAGYMEIPRLVHVGACSESFERRVREGKIDGVTSEGVICKTLHRYNPTRWKIKTDKWLKKLEVFCGSDKDLFNQIR